MASTENLTLSNLARAVASGYEENGLHGVQSRHSHPHELQNEHVSPPKADGGRDAWLFLAGCFCIEALTWGECIPNAITAVVVVTSAFSYDKPVPVCNISYCVHCCLNVSSALEILGCPITSLSCFPH